jgi:transposase-like protein
MTGPRQKHIPKRGSGAQKEKAGAVAGLKRVSRYKIKTNNPLERIIREIRRRTRVVGAFPDGRSALMLVAARLRHIASTKWGKRRYLAMETLLHPVQQEAAA